MSKQERTEKIKMWYDLANDHFNLVISKEDYEKSKDIQGFISKLKEHLIKSKINSKCYKFGDRELYIEDVKIQLKVEKVNNKGFLGIHNTTTLILTAIPLIIGILIALVYKLESINIDLKVMSILILLVIQYGATLIIYMGYIKELRKNTDLNCYNELCLQVIENIENGVYDEIAEPAVIIKKDHIINRLLKKLNT